MFRHTESETLTPFKNFSIDMTPFIESLICLFRESN